MSKILRHAVGVLEFGQRYKFSFCMLAVAIITLGISYSSLTETFEFFQRSSERREIHSHLYSFEKLPLRLKMEEVALSALLQKPDVHTLEIFQDYQHELENTLNVLDALSARLPENKKRLERIKEIVTHRRKELQRAAASERAVALNILTDLRNNNKDEEELEVLNKSLLKDFAAFTKDDRAEQMTLVSYYAIALTIAGVLSVLLTVMTFLGARRDRNQRIKFQRDLRESNDLLTSVLEAQQSVSTATLNPTALKSLITTISTQLTGGHGAIIETLEGDKLRVELATGPMENYTGSTAVLEGTLSGLCMSLNRYIISDDCRYDNRSKDELADKMGIRSLIAVPLRQQGLSFGVLKVYSMSAKEFSEQDGKILDLLAGLMGSALIQAAQFEKAGETINSLKISEGKLKEEKQSAENASSTKSLFLANMSHEIRTPLNAIIGLSNLLMHTPLNDQQRDYLYLIGVSGDSLLNIINDILDFSKIEAGKLSLDPVDFDLIKLLSDLEGIVKQPLSINETTLQFRLDPNLRTTLKGDPSRLLQVFVNLVGNAIKFSPMGKVEIFCRTTVHDNDQVDLHCWIKDNGCGMKPETVNKIFKPFNQADNSSTRFHGGTGLGLSITKHIVNMMGGTISVESEYGQGSIFFFNVKLQRGSRPAVAPLTLPDSKIGTSHALKILVVDDNETNVLVTEQTLKGLGHRADGVLSGAQALRRLGMEHYDMVLMDCNMPTMDGYETTKKIRQHPDPNVAATTIIACTANAMKGDRERCLEAEMDDYLAKPFSMADLAHILGKWGGGTTHDAASSVNAPAEIINYDQDFDFEFLSRRFGSVSGEACREALLAILQAYLRSMPGYVEAISSGYQMGNIKQVQDAAHSAKSSSGNIGAFSLKKRIDAIYRMALESPELISSDQIQDLEEEYAKVSQKIRSLLDKTAS